MFIVWGKKLVRQKAGFVGHFCPVCRSLSVFKATDVSRVPHLYFIPTGPGDPVVLELLCQNCKLLLYADPNTIIELDATRWTLVELAERTSPFGPERLLARLELEDRAMLGNVSESERASLILEPFLALEQTARVLKARGPHRWLTSLMVVSALCGLIASAVLALDCTNPWPPPRPLAAWTIGVIFATVCLLAWTIQRLVSENRRVAHGARVLSPLALALRPLRPNPDEIERLLTFLKKHRTVLGTGLSATSLLQAIEQARV